MKQLVYLLSATLLFAGCARPYKKAEHGFDYKIIADGSGNKLKAGEFFEVSVKQAYKGANKDTVLFNSAENGNDIVPVDSLAIGPMYFKIFTQLRKGDSLIVRQSTDSILKQNPNVPPFVKKGAHFMYHFKILNVYATKEAADKAKDNIRIEAEKKEAAKNAEQIKKDDAAIAAYLSKNKITAVKAPAGTYVEIINAGDSAAAVDSSKVAKVMYTGRVMGSTEAFDSNTDPQFGHTDPLPVRMADKGGLIKGWFDGLSLLKKGSKAKFYIPSSLAYGSRGREPKIKPNEILVFDMEVIDVLTAEQARAAEENEQKEMMARQKKMMDSVNALKKEVGKKK